MLKEKYFLVVSGEFDREPIIYEEQPTNEDISKAIREMEGKSARVEKRFVLKENLS